VGRAARALLHLPARGQVPCRPVRRPRFPLGYRRPPRVLSRIAGGLGDFSWLLQASAPEGLHGAAFRCESWAVDAGMPGTERRSEVSAASMGRKLHEHPDRVESRCVYAVDRAGTTYSVIQGRGQDEIRRHVAYRKPGRPEVSGIIPDALDKLVTALLGVEMPARARG
jgi:hypothetical protein